MEALVVVSGVALVVMIGALVYYLAHESRYAFDRKFDYGFRFALQAVEGDFERDVELDPYASLLTANREGLDGLDEKEEGIKLATLDELLGTSALATGTTLGIEPDKANPDELYRDDWRGMKAAHEGQRFFLLGFATPEYTQQRLALAWAPDASFNPRTSPFNLKLRLRRTPIGTDVQPFEIDLKARPSGVVELPAFVAKTDADRLKGYVFELVAEPAMSQPVAVLRGIFTRDWDPTLAYPRFGIAPLLLGTGIVTLLAMLIATPIAVATALYLSELAPARVREWIKPVLELLASVPTVVLGYLGLMLVAPALQRTFAAAVGLESGRALFTTAIVMAVLLVPTIATIAEDAIRSVPSILRSGGDALGLTVAECIRKVVMPAAKAGLIAAMLLGMARAVGETMIVWILSGGTPTLPTFASAQDAVANLMRPTRGIPDTVAIEMGNVDFEGVHYGHLFLLGLILFAATLLLNLTAQRIARRAAWKH